MFFRISLILIAVIVKFILGGNSMLQESTDEISTNPIYSDTDFEELDTSAFVRDTILEKADGPADPGWRPIDLYSKNNYAGTIIRGVIALFCQNIAKNVGKQMRSIDTKGSCVMIFPGVDCTGDGIAFRRHSSKSMDIQPHMANEIDDAGLPMSIKLCDQDDSHSVKFYTKAYGQGSYVTLYLPFSGACVEMPSGFDNAVTSIRMSSAACIVVYTDHNCAGRQHRFYKTTQWVHDLRGTTFNNKISSVQLCTAPDGGGLVYMQMMGATGTRNATVPNPSQNKLEQGKSHTRNPNVVSPPITSGKPKSRRKRSIRKA